MRKSSIIIVLGLGLLLVFPCMLSAQFKNKAKLDSLEKVIKIGSKFEKANAYLALTHIFYSHDSMTLAHKYSNLGIDFAVESDNKNALAELYSLKGYIYTYWGNYEKAIDFFTKTVQTASALKNGKTQIAGYHGMGRVYNDLQNPLKAEEVLLKAMQIAKTLYREQDLRAIYNDIGVTYMMLKKYKKSIAFLEESMKISILNNDSLSYLYALVNIGEVYRYAGDFDNAQTYYLRALKDNSTIQNKQAQSAAYGNLGYVFLQRNDYENAIMYNNLSLEISSKAGITNYMLETYKTLSSIYLETKDFEKSLEYLIKYDNLKDSIFNKSRYNDIRNLQTQFELDQKDAQTKYWQQKYSNRNIILLASVVIILFFITILVLLFSRYKLSQKLHLIETNQLSLTIDEKNRELVSLLLNSSRKENIFGELNKTIDALSGQENPNDIQNALVEIKKRLKSDMIEENNWDAIKLHFEQVHPDYFSKLKVLHPNLTQSELRMCADIKMNMSSKDIASLMNIGIRAVQTSRYRLKKKLNLASTDSLIQYLQNL